MTINIKSNLNNFKEFSLCERDGRLADALSILIKAKSYAKEHSIGKIYEANIDRILNKVKKKAEDFFINIQNLPIFESKNNPRMYVDSRKENQLPIISLTTISSRIDRVEKTISSICNQTRKVHSINLYISSEPFLIDKGIQHTNPVLKDIAAMGVNIYHTPNIGPYRKQLPLISQLNAAKAPPQTPFVTIDDDVIYPSTIIDHLMTELENSEAIVAHRGRKMRLDNGRILEYGSFPPPSERTSLFNVGTGKNGIAYRLGYFSKNPRDFVGHIIAPTADDIWCKWVTSAYCIPTLILEPKAAYDPSLDFPETEPLDKNGLFHKYNAKGINDNAIENLETYFAANGKSLAVLLELS